MTKSYHVFLHQRVGAVILADVRAMACLSPAPILLKAQRKSIWHYASEPAESLYPYTATATRFRGFTTQGTVFPEYAE